MRNILILIILTFTITLTTGCVYRSGVIQGGQIDERAIKRVEVGMDRDQVRRLLGTPTVRDAYHPDRWDYLYYTLNMRNSKAAERVSVYFDKGFVTKVETVKPE